MICTAVQSYFYRSLHLQAGLLAIFCHYLEGGGWRMEQCSPKAKRQKVLSDQADQIILE
jgi:hypothetical protein